MDNWWWEIIAASPQMLTRLGRKNHQKSASSSPSRSPTRCRLNTRNLASLAPCPRGPQHSYSFTYSYFSVLSHHQYYHFLSYSPSRAHSPENDGFHYFKYVFLHLVYAFLKHRNVLSILTTKDILFCMGLN